MEDQPAEVPEAIPDDIPDFDAQGFPPEPERAPELEPLRPLTGDSCCAHCLSRSARSWSCALSVETGGLKGFGFLTMSTPAAAAVVMHAMHGYRIDGKMIVVKQAGAPPGSGKEEHSRDFNRDHNRDYHRDNRDYNRWAAAPTPVHRDSPRGIEEHGRRRRCQKTIHPTELTGF
ncbi:hypothetical protein Vretifemale_7345 [Volvox reticuliferus]|nr:hypothetical protein Vretifemale_7345 [Volvox reticuliferus]